MKKKALVYYLDLMKSAQDKKEWVKQKRYGEIALKKLSTLSYSPLEEWFLYCRLGFAYNELGEYSLSSDIYYKANLIASKNHLNPSYIAYTLHMIGNNLLRLHNINQALSRFQKVEEYYQKHGDTTFPMDKRNHFNNYTFLGNCYGFKNNLEKVKEIIEEKLLPFLSIMSTDIVFGNYYHLKGEYLMSIKEYAQARDVFQKGIKFNEDLKLYYVTIEPKISLATIDLLEGKLEPAIQSLEFLLKETHRLKLNELICEVGLLLSKCYALKNPPDQTSGRAGMPDKSASIEKQIKPLLIKLDITWLYEKTKEFEQLYRQLQPIYPCPTVPFRRETETKSIPRILMHPINKYYDNSSYKDIIIGQSASMIEVYQLIEKIAPTDLPVLIQGETGTGKELIAHAIHHSSFRKEKSWLALNCGAVPEALLENELFGHVKGAFTDAQGDKKGYIETASGGTLLLDEIGDMSPSMQQKLLRVIEDKVVWRLGAEKPIPVNTRFIFASNQNIEELVKTKKFREDLYYRINTIVITLPSLRDRKDDIPLLADYFLKKYTAKRMTNDQLLISNNAINILMNYNWNGNVRELENEIKRICTLYPRLNDAPPDCRAGVGQADTKEITESMLSDTIKNYKPLVSLLSSSLKEIKKQASDDMEKKVIIEELKKYNGNITRTARHLGCHRFSLQRKIKRLKIEIPAESVTKK